MDNALFLGIIDNSKNFYSVFEKKDEILILNEDIKNFYEKEIIITEEEIKQYFDSYKNIEDLREKSYCYYKKNIQGQAIDIGSYKNIRISRKSAERYKHYGADERKLLIVIKLLEILKTAKYCRASDKYKDRSDNIVKFYYFTNKIKLKNEEYFVYITIGEDNRGNLFYDLDEKKEP